MAFSHPWFLLGLLSIGIPIILHLFELRRPQRVLFSNVEFIQQVKLLTARQRKLKHWLILASRIGAVICIVLVFAQPYIPAPEQQTAHTDAVQVVIDDSPSMQQAGADDLSLLEQATQQARDLPLAFTAGARYYLLPGGRGESITKETYRTAVEQVQVSGQAEKIEGLMRRMQQQRRGEGPLFIFSDFQRSGFSSASLASLDSTQQVFLVPLSGKRQPNVFVDSIWVDDAFIRVGAEVLVQIRLRNGGQETASDCGIKVLIGAKQVAAFQRTIPAGQSALAQVKIRVPDGKLLEGRVQLDDYPVDFDNVCYFTLQPASPIRVVEVSSEAALSRLYSNEPLFAYQHVNAVAVNYQTLQAANIILLREVTQLSAGLRDNLRQAVQQGATLVLVPSANPTSRGAYMQLFRALGIGRVQWQSMPQASPALQEIAPPSPQNPFFREVFAGVNARAGMPKVFPLMQWARSGIDVLHLRNGENYLSGFPSGRGTTYLFAAPFSLPYSDFMQHPLFVPVLYRLAMQSYQQEQQAAYRMSQSTVRVRLPRASQQVAAETVYQLVQDSVRIIPGQQEQGSTLRLDLPAAMRQPGFYRLERAGKVVTTLAFNLDKRESDLRSYSVAELRQLLGTAHPNVQIYEASQEQTVAARFKAARVGTPLWQYCVWGALAFLLLEVLLLRLSRWGAASTVAA
jgi:Aerotolerance regulator N-terminal